MPEPSEFDLMALLPPAGQAACEGGASVPAPAHSAESIVHVLRRKRLVCRNLSTFDDRQGGGRPLLRHL